MDDQSKYKYGVYYNPDDSRVIVPKGIRFLGFTLNFAKWEAYFIIGLILLVVVGLGIVGSNNS